MTITFSIPGSNEDADLLVDPEDRAELIQRLRDRRLDELATVSPSPTH